METVRDASLVYLRRGWQPIPVPAGSKNPGFAGWETFSCTAEEAPRYFANGGNVGLLLGAPSAGLVDVDIDCPEARAIAPACLPPTQLVSGRPGNPRSHWWYAVEPADVRTSKFQYTLKGERLGVTLIELRATGGQTIVPPSVHDQDRDRYEWHEFGEPAQVRAADLRRIVQKIAIGALLARFWPAPGARHDAALPIAGLFLNAGWKVEEAAELVLVASRAAGDDDPQNRQQAVHDTFAKRAAEKKTTGVPSLKKYLPEEIVATLNQWCVEISPNPPKHAKEEAKIEDPWQRIKDAKAFAVEERKRIEGIAKDVLFPGIITMITGPKGIGKSLIGSALGVASTIREGTFRGDRVRPARVLYLDRENPEGISQKRLLSWGVLETNNFHILTREQDPPLLMNRKAWADFPVEQYDVVVIDSVGSFSEGVTEKEGKDTTLILATLRDLAARGVGLLLLNNTEKTGTNVRGRGEWADRVDVHYEVRDMTGVAPTGRRHWSEEVPADGAADWRAREARRRGKHVFRIAFFSEKFRIGPQPDPFVLEMALPTDAPWTLTDVTVELDRAEQAARTKAEDDAANTLEKAAAALAKEVKDRAAKQAPLLKEEATDFLCHEQKLSRKAARDLIEAGDGVRWLIKKLEGRKGRPQALFPVEDPPSQTDERRKSDPSKTPHETQASEEGISADPDKSSGGNITASKTASNGLSEDDLFPPSVKSDPAEMGVQKSLSNGGYGDTLISAAEEVETEGGETRACPRCRKPGCYLTPGGWFCRLSVEDRRRWPKQQQTGDTEVF